MTALRCARSRMLSSLSASAIMVSATICKACMHFSIKGSMKLVQAIVPPAAAGVELTAQTPE